jgi:hypothetical protein
MLIGLCKEVARRAQHVSINPERLEAMADGAPAHLLAMPSWDGQGMFSGHAEDVVTWLMTVNAINFSYFPEPEQSRWFTRVGGKDVGEDDEAFGVLAAIGAAVKNGVPFGDFSWVQQMDEHDLAPYLAPAGGAGRLPMMAQRLESMLDLAGARKFFASPASLFTAAEGSAARFVDVLTGAAPMWRDIRQYDELTLPFHKRAWLCAAMIHGRFQNDPIRRFRDPEVIPAFADYRLPQILRGSGVIQLSPTLAAHIDALKPIEAHSPVEVELRAVTIAAAAQLRERIALRMPDVTMMQVDHFLWRMAVKVSDQLPPFHRTRTTDY